MVTRTFNWLFRVLLVLALLAFLLCALIYYFATRSLPDYDREYNTSGNADTMEIVRDNKGVPHIFATSDSDVFFGLGFAHAQDRLWQMMLRRRAAQGRLSEIFGAETADADEFIRRLDITTLARTSLSVQSPEAMQALKAYSMGVNAWLKTIQTEALGRGAPEYFLFKPSIAPWTPADSLAILKLMAVESSTHLETDILRARTSIAIGADLLRDIMPDDPSLGTTAMPEYAQLFDLTPNSELAALAPRNKLHAIKTRGFQNASNVWAAQGARTAGKASLLAADPHNALAAPGQWMLARLELQSGGVIGATIPGLPLILSGRSERLAWGMAASYVDDLDVYVEQLNPANVDEYKSGLIMKTFKKRDVILEIKDGVSKTLELRWTDNGPVIPTENFGLKDITPSGHVTSLRSTTLEYNDASFTALYEMMKVQNANQVSEIYNDYVSPTVNLIYADKDNIGYQLIGKIPDRRLGHVGQGRIPAQGWLIRNQWKGYMDYEDNPANFNPAGGVVANTNNKITEKPFPKHISFNWGDTYRFQRLTKLINERKIHTRDSFMEAQLDSISFAARTMLPLAAKELWFTGNPAPDGTPERKRQIALELLANWNGDMNEHMPEPLIYAAWMRNLQAFIIRDDLGKLAGEFMRVDPIFIERVFRNIDGAGVWCDIRQSTKEETCSDIAKQALDAALIELEALYGGRIDSWQWGQAHQAIHDHTVLGHIPFLSWVTNIRQSTSGGDHTLLRAVTKNKGPFPYSNVHAAGFRALIDFSDLESSLYIASTGQSGHPFSRHYDDLAQLWRRGEYIPMALDPELARAGAVGITRLVPIE